MKILFTGGGTGGHIYPALAVADQLKQEFEQIEIKFVGTSSGLEADIVPRADYKLETISVSGFPRQITWRWIPVLAKTGIGLLQAKKIINNFKPDIVVGTGGYVAGPTVLAAALSGVPTLIHEQNAYPGVTNRILAKVVDKIALTSREAKPHFKQQDKISITGNPVRPEILQKDSKLAHKELDLDPDCPVILVVGGSRGAESINQALIDSYPQLKATDWQVIHITGERDFEWVKEAAQSQGLAPLDKGQLRVISYFYNMEAGLAAADLIVSRAGATSIAEITACGLPAIFIPFPHAAANHQEHNARALEKAGAARMILDDELTGDKLFEQLTKVITKNKLQQMSKASQKLGRPQATEQIITLIQDLIKA